MARYTLSPEVAVALIGVHTALQRLEAEGFRNDLALLCNRSEDLPPIVRDLFELCGDGRSLWYRLRDLTSRIHDAVDYLGLTPAPPQETMAPVKKGSPPRRPTG